MQDLQEMIHELVVTHIPKLLDRVEAVEAKAAALEAKNAELEVKLDTLLEIAKGGGRSGRGKKKQQAADNTADTALAAEVSEPVVASSVEDVAQVAPVQQGAACYGQPATEQPVDEAQAITAAITPQMAAAYLSLVQNGYDATDVYGMAAHMGTTPDVVRFIKDRPITWVQSMADNVPF